MNTTDSRPAPRPDQHDALSAVARWAVSSARRGQLIEAPGTGKTLLALWVAEQLAPSLVAYAAPSLTLLDQTLRVWTNAKAPGRAAERLVICSDVTVADDLELANLSVPPTTEVAAIRRWLQAPTPRGSQRQIFVTYQSASRLGAALWEAGLTLPLLLADEAHRLAAPGTSSFRAVLDDQVVPVMRRLFLTGTPRIGRVVGADAHVLEPELALDDHQRFGDVLHRLSFGDAISRGLLADYEIDVVILTDPTLDPAAVGDAAALTAAVRADLISGSLQRVFSFHRDRQAALAFQERLHTAMTGTPRGHGPTGWVLGAVFGTHPVNARVQTLAALRQGRGVIASVRALAEGIDLPELDAVMLVDPKRSTVDIAQVVGRALRRDPANPQKRARIVVPVVATGAETPESALAASAWEPVWRVVAAMAAHDERLAAELARSTRWQAAWAAVAPAEPRAHHGDRSPSQDIDIPLRFRVPRGISVEQLSRAVSLAAVRATADPFEQGMGHLEAFVGLYGTAAVPEGWCSADGYALRRWCAVQQRLQAQGRLADERVSRLAGLPGWRWSEVDPDWEHGFGVLRQFVRGHNHTRVPLGWIDRRGFWLGSWVMSIRAAYHAGILAPDRQAILEAFPGWTWGQADATATWRANTPPRPGHRGTQCIAAQSRWVRALRLAAKRLPTAGREYCGGLLPHARWAPSGVLGSRPSPIAAFLQIMRPWLHRHIGPGSTKTLVDAFPLDGWFDVLLGRSYGRPQEIAASARGEARKWLTVHTTTSDFGFMDGAPESAYALDWGDTRDSVANLLRGSLPILGGWAPPPVDEWREALTSVLVYGLAHAAVPIALGFDRRAIAFRDLLRWTRRRWGQPAKNAEWLVPRLLSTTFNDPATSELWFGTSDPLRAERAIANLIQPADEEATSESRRRSHSVRVDLVRAAQAEANELARRLTGEQWRRGRLTLACVPLRIQWSGRAPNPSLSVDVPRRLTSALRYARTRAWNDRLPERTRSGEITVLAARPVAAGQPNTSMWIALWERSLDAKHRVLEAGQLTRRGTVATIEIWETAVTEDGRRAEPGRRASGLITWPPVPPGVSAAADSQSVERGPEELRSDPAVPATAQDAPRVDGLARPGRNAAHQRVLPDGTISRDRTDRWDYNLRAATGYAAEHGHLRPGRKDRPMGVNLWMWLKNQELRLDAGTLEPGRAAALEALPAWRKRQDGRPERTRRLRRPS